jgi:hypothetical protein
MTATLPAPPSPRPWAPSAPDWTQQLAALLRPATFPARQDELLATLLRRRAPGHLLWRLAPLPRTRRFGSLEEVLAYLDGHVPTVSVAEPL